MTDQNMIPAEKVRELIEKFKEDTKHDCIVADLRALLPAPPQPTSGLLGRWAKHPDYGDVMCVWNKPKDGWINIYKRANNGVTGAEWYQIQFSELTFPEQAMKPEDVPAGEAWLVDVEDPKESYKSIVALKAGPDFWRTSDEVTICSCWYDSEVTLISPMTSEHPGKGDEQPASAWRIEHDHKNLRIGEYIIDCEDEGGVVSEIIEHIVRFEGSERNCTSNYYSPFIVFPSVDAATPEAIEEAKRARDKETGE